MNLDGLTVLPIIKEFISDLNYTRDVLAVIGLFYATKVVFKVSYRCWAVLNTYILPRFLSVPNFSIRYGGTWAIVTGASEGIGKSYAMKLAERNMNIFLISRNIKKLENTATEIKSKYNVQTKCFQMDLSELSDGKQYALLKEELSCIDVGVLVNNVGMMYDHLQYFTTVPINRQLQIIDLNVTATVLMTSLVLPIMVEKHNGAIVNLSSISSIHPTPLMTLYSAAKSFVVVFTRALQYEYSGEGITFQVVQPSYVSTSMTHNAGTNFFMSSPDNFVDSSIRALGHTTRCFGHWSHGLFGYAGEIMPERFYMFCAMYVHPILYRLLVGVSSSDKKTN